MSPEPPAWRSLLGREPVDFVAEVRRLLARGTRALHVGTDSLRRGFHTHYVTAVVLLGPASGGRVFYRRRRTRGAHSLARRLFREVELSLEVACDLGALIDEEPVVHVDANQDARHRSSRYVRSLTGMVTGYGFRVRVKPDAWCATHVADYVVKRKHLKVA